MYVSCARVFCKKGKKKTSQMYLCYKGHHNYHGDTCIKMAQHVDRITVSVRKVIDFSFVK